MPGEKLVGIMQHAVSKARSADLVFGTVTSVEPVEVTLESNLVLDEDFVQLSPLCTGLSTVADATGHTHTIIAPMQVGDSLLLLRSADGQLFYGLQRV